MLSNKIQMFYLKYTFYRYVWYAKVTNILYCRNLIKNRVKPDKMNDVSQMKEVNDFENVFTYLHKANLPQFYCEYTLITYSLKIRHLQDNHMPISLPPPVPSNHPLLLLLPDNYVNSHDIIRRILNLTYRDMFLRPLTHSTWNSILSCLPNLYSDNCVLDDYFNLLVNVNMH